LAVEASGGQRSMIRFQKSSTPWPSLQVMTQREPSGRPVRGLFASGGGRRGESKRTREPGPRGDGAGAVPSPPARPTEAAAV
jgi:hypothetical protein